MKESLGYIPSKIPFVEVDSKTPGMYSIDDDGGSNELLHNLEALTQSFIDMENIIKKNFKLTQEKREKFISDNPVMITLREELEQVYEEKKKQEEKINNLNIIISQDRKEWLEKH